MDGKKSLYSVLGLAPDAPQAVIKAAYRALAKQYHPDGAGAGDSEAAAKFIELQEAYEVLSDEVRRAAYDRELSHAADEGLPDEEGEASIDPDAIWAEEAAVHPEIDRIHQTLNAYSTALGNRFRLAVVNRECGDNPAAFAADLDRAFFRKYFGENPEVQTIARQLLASGNRKATKALNKAVQSGKLKDPISAKRLIAVFQKLVNFPDAAKCNRYKVNPAEPAEANKADIGFGAGVKKDASKRRAVVMVSLLAFGVLLSGWVFLSSVPNSRLPVEEEQLTRKIITDRIQPDILGPASASRRSDMKSPDLGSREILPVRQVDNSIQYPKIIQEELPYDSAKNSLSDIKSLGTKDSTEVPLPTQKLYDGVADRISLGPTERLRDALIARGIPVQDSDLITSTLSEWSSFNSREVPNEFKLTIRKDGDPGGRDTFTNLELSFRRGNRSTVTITAEIGGSAKPIITERIMPEPGLDNLFTPPINQGVTSEVLFDSGVGEDSVSRSTRNRVALVIGNSSYRKIPWLENSDEDANSMAYALSRLGFKVIKVTNATLSQMVFALEKFSRELSEDTDVALVYYSGHAVDIRSGNYLLPINIGAKADQAKIARSSLALSSLLGTMSSARISTKIVILDACRNNPLDNEARGGLAEVRAESGTLIAYSTAPGAVAVDGEPGAGNSPYTYALVNALRNPALTIEDTFRSVRSEVMRITEGKQVPWESSSLISAFSFAPQAGGGQSGQIVAPNEPKPPLPLPIEPVDGTKVASEQAGESPKFKKKIPLETAYTEDDEELAGMVEEAPVAPKRPKVRPEVPVTTEVDVQEPSGMIEHANPTSGIQVSSQGDSHEAVPVIIPKPRQKPFDAMATMTANDKTEASTVPSVKLPPSDGRMVQELARIIHESSSDNVENAPLSIELRGSERKDQSRIVNNTAFDDNNLAQRKLIVNREEAAALDGQAQDYGTTALTDLLPGVNPVQEPPLEGNGDMLILIRLGKGDLRPSRALRKNVENSN